MPADRAHPAQVRALAAAATEAVRAATAAEDDAFRRATERLGAHDREQVGLVLGDVLRMLLEERHPGGLSGEDAGEVIARCARDAVTWFPEVDVDVLVVVLAGAVGVHPDDDAEQRTPGPLELAQHASLLVNDLLDVGSDGDQVDVEPYLHAAFAEIMRAETVEHP